MKHELMLLLALGACRIGPPIKPPVDGDAGVHDGALEAAPHPTGTPCERAWQRITELGCSVTVPRTGTWSASCTNAEANGVDMKNECTTAAKTCADVKACLGEP